MDIFGMHTEDAIAYLGATNVTKSFSMGFDYESGYKYGFDCTLPDDTEIRVVYDSHGVVIDYFLN